MNKFVGVLDAELTGRRPVQGYFISLAGSTESALEQEQQRLRAKLILLTATQVVGELIRGRSIIARGLDVPVRELFWPCDAPALES